MMLRENLCAAVTAAVVCAVTASCTEEPTMTKTIISNHTPPQETGIVDVSRNKLVLATPPDRPPCGSLRYALGFPFQAGPNTFGLMVMRMTEETPNYGFLDGSDVILLDELKPPCREQIFAATRNEIEEGEADNPTRLLMRSPLIGGFVPRGALRANGTPHPHAGTGFGVGQAHRLPFREGRFSWGDPERMDLNEVYQLAFDGKTFTTRRTEIRAQNGGDPLRIADSGWAILTIGICSAISDGDDLLLATMAARSDGTAMGVGVARWARQNGIWQPVGFDPVVTTQGSVPHGPNPMERYPWMEPSLARDADENLLFAVRCADSFQQEGDVGQGYTLRVWRSTQAGEWKQMLDVPKARLNSPVTVNVTADGSVYLASNPYDTAFIPETDAAGRGREKLVLWPLDSQRGRLEPALPIRDCLAEFGAPPSASKPEQWMADHPNGMTVRLKDGRWHHILSYRVCHCPRYSPSGTPPSPHSGCYIEEVVSRGASRPVWRFAEEKRSD
jgi:hypothetical protein